MEVKLTHYSILKKYDVYYREKYQQYIEKKAKINNDIKQKYWWSLLTIS